MPPPTYFKSQNNNNNNGYNDNYFGYDNNQPTQPSPYNQEYQSPLSQQSYQQQYTSYQEQPLYFQSSHNTFNQQNHSYYHKKQPQYYQPQQFPQQQQQYDNINTTSTFKQYYSVNKQESPNETNNGFNNGNQKTFNTYNNNNKNYRQQYQKPQYQIKQKTQEQKEDQTLNQQSTLPIHSQPLAQQIIEQPPLPLPQQEQKEEQMSTNKYQQQFTKTTPKTTPKTKPVYVPKIPQTSNNNNDYITTSNLDEQPQQQQQTSYNIKPAVSKETKSYVKKPIKSTTTTTKKPLYVPKQSTTQFVEESTMEISNLPPGLYIQTQTQTQPQLQPQQQQQQQQPQKPPVNISQKPNKLQKPFQKNIEKTIPKEQEQQQQAPLSPPSPSFQPTFVVKQVPIIDTKIVKPNKPKKEYVPKANATPIPTKVEKATTTPLLEASTPQQQAPLSTSTIPTVASQAYTPIPAVVSQAPTPIPTVVSQAYTPIPTQISTTPIPTVVSQAPTPIPTVVSQAPIPIPTQIPTIEPKPFSLIPPSNPVVVQAINEKQQSKQQIQQKKETIVDNNSISNLTSGKLSIKSNPTGPKSVSESHYASVKTIRNTNINNNKTVKTATTDTVKSQSKNSKKSNLFDLLNSSDCEDNDNQEDDDSQEEEEVQEEVVGSSAVFDAELIEQKEAELFSIANLNLEIDLNDIGSIPIVDDEQEQSINERDVNSKKKSINKSHHHGKKPKAKIGKKGSKKSKKSKSSKGKKKPNNNDEDLASFLKSEGMDKEEIESFLNPKMPERGPVYNNYSDSDDSDFMYDCGHSHKAFRNFFFGDSSDDEYDYDDDDDDDDDEDDDSDEMEFDEEDDWIPNYSVYYNGKSDSIVDHKFYYYNSGKYDKSTAVKVYVKHEELDLYPPLDKFEKDIPKCFYCTYAYFKKYWLIFKRYLWVKFASTVKVYEYANGETEEVPFAIHFDLTVHYFFTTIKGLLTQYCNVHSSEVVE